MPTKRRRVHNHNSSGKPPISAPEQEFLPVDLLLEIIAWCDVTTVVRFARTCRTLRLAILDPAFRRRFALQSAADGGIFDPALLLGVSFLRHTVHGLVPARRVIHTPRRRVRLDTTSRSVWRSFEPVASRGSLLLLRGKRGVSLPGHDAFHYALRVCNTFTGAITSLPPIAGSNLVYPHAFLSVGDGNDGGSYELLVADWNMCFQTFSSKFGQWSDVRESSFPTHPLFVRASSRPAVVIGRVVYWLCVVPASDLCENGTILSLDVDEQAATTMDLPHGCFYTMMDLKKNKQHLLLASVHGRLSVLVAESRGISMWTLTATSSTATWSRELVISMEKIIEKPVGLASSPPPFDLLGFGERSGAVIVRVVDSNQLLRLDLGTKVVRRLRDGGNSSVTCLFLQEIDLVSCLQAMKLF